MLEFFKVIFNKVLKAKVFYKILVIMLLLLYIFLIFITTKTVNVIATYPGYISPVGSIVSIDSNQEKGTYYTTSVLQNRNISLIEYWLHQNNFNVDLKEFDPILDLTTAEEYIAGVYYKKNSVSKALIAAYKTANENNIDIDINFEFKGIRVTSVDKNFDNRLKVGDLIIELNGVELVNFEQTRTIIGEINDGDLTSEDNISLKVVRDEIELVVLSPAQLLESNFYGIGIYGEAYYEVIDSTPTYSLVDDFSSTGPSGGLMQTLYIYDALTEFDLTSGLIIAGTGTIEINYDPILDEYQFVTGQIGGVKQKILTAQKNKVDVFFIPSSNYLEAFEVYERIAEPTFELVSIVDLYDAIAWLEGRSNE